MASGFTIFLTYQLSDTPYTAATGNFGHARSLHCGYIQTLTTDSFQGKTINFFFNNEDDFPFLYNSGSTSATGFTATKLYAIVQLVSGITDNEVTIKPDPTNWYIIDVTDQIKDHTVGDVIERKSLVDSVFNIDPITVVYQTGYNLDYLNYPTNVNDTLSGYPEENFRLAFGEETYFYGNVSADIRATAYVTDIPISLPLNQFNSTTNPTWDGQSSVYISEIGIYNSAGILVGIAKLNTPIEKNSNIGRTILFAMDF